MISSKALAQEIFDMIGSYSLSNIQASTLSSKEEVLQRVSKKIDDFAARHLAGALGETCV